MARFPQKGIERKMCVFNLYKLLSETFFTQEEFSEILL